MNLNQAATEAQSVNQFSEKASAAIGICIAAGVDPFEQVVIEGVWLARWQAKIIEAVWEAELLELLKEGQ
ncbi:MAG: hypothetical protein ABJP02_04965 [Parasphingorhabdus sp.]|uniref:hypothetical protein n=1 Tax=Parasphingorhabdus sp. TaxID=2709688 RepID=UPI00329A20F1